VSSILVVGEAVLDVVEHRDGTTTVHPGGSPANVAVGLARLGHDVSFATQLGHDDAGSQIHAHLVRAGVEVQDACDGVRTPTAHARIGEDGAAEYSFSIEWSLDASAVAINGMVDHVHTGSIATQMEPGATTVAACVDDLRARASISFDPNVRGALVGDRAAAVERAERLVARADVVKASDEDLAWLYPHGHLPDVLQAWAAAGPAFVVVTLGAAGALVCARGHVERVNPVSVAVVDTVGAGDSSMAALIDGLARDGYVGASARARLHTAGIEQIVAVAARAARAAAITVSRSGASPPTLAELEMQQAT
jgi:fructokinase